VAQTIVTTSVRRSDSSIAVRPIKLAFEQVADQLRDLILQGDLLPGAKLPSEPELASQFGVSRSTVREALRMLSSQNLISTSRGVGGGSHVRHPSPDEIANLLHTNIGLLTGSRLVGIPELLEAREMLEVPAARLAARKHTPEHVAELRSTLIDRMSSLPEARIFEFNKLFHEIILDAAGNHLLRMMTQPVFSFLQGRFLRSRADTSFWDKVEVEHAAIVDAIEASDPERAGDEMERHLEHLRPTYEQIDRMLQRSDKQS
jgi:DNA-binding FadR family transcriptional regulator